MSSLIKAACLFLTMTSSVLAGFPTWSFQHANSRMEWNTQPPIQFSIRETLQDASAYDCIVIGIIEEDTTTNATDRSRSHNDSDATITSLDSLGSLFHTVDDKYCGILSKWMEGKDDLSVSATSSAITFTSPKGRMSLDVINQRRKKKRKFEDWDELSKVCKVSLDGTIEVQRLVVCRIKGDPTSANEAGKLGRTIGTLVASHLKTEGERWAFLMPPPPVSDDNQTEAPLFGDFVSEMTTSLWSTLYKDNRFKSSPKGKRNLSQLQEAPVSVDLIWDHPMGTDASPTPIAFLNQARQSIIKGEIIASGVSLAKDIVNAPHNVLNSVSLADTAKRLAVEYPRLTCQVLNAEDCDKHGMGAFLGVARGAETPPQFIHLIYRPRRISARRL